MRVYIYNVEQLDCEKSGKNSQSNGSGAAYFPVDQRGYQPGDSYRQSDIEQGKDGYQVAVAFFISQRHCQIKESGGSQQPEEMTGGGR